MKQFLVLTYLIITALTCSAQSITLTQGYDTIPVSMIPEYVGDSISYDMCFDLIYRYQLQGFLLEEWTNHWVDGYTAYYYMREGFSLEWIEENIDYHPVFQFTLTHFKNSFE